MLDEMVERDLLLQNHSSESANGVPAPIGEARNEEEMKYSELLAASSEGGVARRTIEHQGFSVPRSSLIWDCIMHSSRHLICVHRATRQS